MDHPLDGVLSSPEAAAGDGLPPLRQVVIAGGVAALVSLIGFAVATALRAPVLTDPTDVLDGGAAPAAAAGVALLVADVILPVPASVVMVAHGALFGLVPGALLSLAGRVGAAVVGAAIGRTGRRWRGKPGQEGRGHNLVHRWGALAVVASRPVPVVAEAVAVAAGAAHMPWPRFVAAAAAGALPEAVLYALAGAVAATFNNAALIFSSLIVVTTASWLLWSRDSARSPREARP